MNIKQADAVETDEHLRTILVVDDSPVNLGVVVENLEMHGYNVLVAQDGKEALQRALLASPGLILLDVMMPGIDGFEVCRQLKAHERTCDIPVIFMTSLGNIQDKVKGFDAGAVDYIIKPLLFEEVRARINVHLELRALRQSLETRNNKLKLVIAEREKSEEALRESHRLLNEIQREQIEQRYQGMVDSRLEKSAKLEAVGTLAAGIAHDFNNLLGSIVGFAEMAGDELPDGSMGKYSIEQILTASFRARDIVARMLTFARQGSDKPAVAEEIVFQVRETIALLSVSYKPDLDFRFHTSIEQATVMADPGHLQQIVMNLCINAADAMNHRGVIVVRIDPVTLDRNSPEGSRPGVCLTVADCGHGISAAVQERLFDPFFTTKAPNKGSGLGLSVVYGIVTQLGGVVSVQSRTQGSNHGTEFRVFLPLAEESCIASSLQDGDVDHLAVK